jgi:GNAT superfamily N-acetyltransferase
MAAIRKATLADVPEIVRMSALFYPTTHYADWCAMDEATVADLASSLIEGHIFFVAEDAGQLVGMVGLFVCPFLFNRTEHFGCEVVWWVAPSARGSHVAASLLVAIEQPLRDAGATRVQMVHMPNSPPQASALYERLGYSQSEISYTKDI